MWILVDPQGVTRLHKFRTVSVMESARSATAKARLVALKVTLEARGIAARVDEGSLAVLADDGEQVDTITCKPWPAVQDAWWFFDCENIPIAEADNVVLAADTIVTEMRRSGARV